MYETEKPHTKHIEIEIKQNIKLILLKCKLQNRTGKSNVETFDLSYMRVGKHYNEANLVNDLTEH